MLIKRNIKNIGKIKGKLLVFGGVYSNFQALEAIQKIASKLHLPPTQIICTGDIVAYCAEPEKCVQVIKSWGIHCIAGNVELQLRSGEIDCGCNFDESGRCNIFSRQWYPYAQHKISTSSIEWMQSLPEFIRFQYAGLKGFVLHGSIHQTAEFIFESTNWEKKQQNFQETSSQLILAGHCGLPFAQEKNGLYWLNAGVIGMPANDGTSRVWYMLLDDENGGLHFQKHSFYYNYKKAANLMLKNKLPVEYAQTLSTGIWDNCEILPQKETILQGQKII